MLFLNSFCQGVIKIPLFIPILPLDSAPHSPVCFLTCFSALPSPKFFPLHLLPDLPAALPAFKANGFLYYEWEVKASEGSSFW